MIDSVSEVGNSKFRQAMGGALPAKPEQPPKEEVGCPSLPNNPPMIQEEDGTTAGQTDLTDGRRASRLHRTKYQQAMEPTTVDRLPPHEIDAEIGVLSCIMISPKECLNEAIEFFGSAGKDVFYDLRHKDIYAACVEMQNDQKEIDVITLQSWLKNKQLLEQVGGIVYLSNLPDVVPSAANLSYYMEIVKEKYVLRKTIHVCTDVVSRIYDWEGHVEQLMDEIERDMFGISLFMDQKPAPTIREDVQGAITTIEEYHQRNGALIGISTGFADLDQMTGGLIGGDMIVIAARPSMGKTSLAMNIAEHVAVSQKIPVGIFSLEMTRQSLVLRMICSRARVNIRTIHQGFMADRDFPKITHAAGKIAAAPIHIEDKGGLSILQLRAKARRMVQQYGIKLFVIDYMQLLNAMVGDKRLSNRRQEMGLISNGIKELAKELNVPIIALSQLNREMDKQKGRKPKLSDLKESGDIEQDADLIGLLYKPESKDDVPEDPNAIAITLDIAKQRNGPTGEIDLLFLKMFTRFENAAKISEEDIPGKTTLF